MGLSGTYIWIFLPPSFRSGSKRKMRKDRYFHRLVGITTALFFIMASLSGLTHVIKKYASDKDVIPVLHPNITQPEFVTTSLSAALDQSKHPVDDIALARIKGLAYFRLNLISDASHGKSTYISCKDNSILAKGDARHASELAVTFSQSPLAKAEKTELVSSLTNQYDSTQIQLPVQMVSLSNSQYTSIAIDTANSQWSTRTKPSDTTEAQIFNNLHLLHFMDLIGPTARDWASALACIMILLTSGLGASLWLRSRKR